VVVGSGVYAGNWLKGAATFLTRHEAELTGRPVWLFSDGPTGEGDPVALMKGWRFPQSLQPVADRIRPRDIVLFHGALDPAKLNWAERLILRAIKAPVGDYRDWPAIEAWAGEVAKACA
jgi:menaquinone-dependent protoporphyrinogen oxidase